MIKKLELDFDLSDYEFLDFGFSGGGSLEAFGDYF